jgi:hypothetical protein
MSRSAAANDNTNPIDAMCDELRKSGEIFVTTILHKLLTDFVSELAREGIINPQNNDHIWRIFANLLMKRNLKIKPATISRATKTGTGTRSKKAPVPVFTPPGAGGQAPAPFIPSLPAVGGAQFNPQFPVGGAPKPPSMGIPQVGAGGPPQFPTQFPAQNQQAQPPAPQFPTQNHQQAQFPMQNHQAPAAPQFPTQNHQAPAPQFPTQNHQAPAPQFPMQNHQAPAPQFPTQNHQAPQFPTQNH